jgi:hypothetical protein
MSMVRLARVEINQPAGSIYSALIVAPMTAMFALSGQRLFAVAASVLCRRSSDHATDADSGERDDVIAHCRGTI